MAKAHLKIADDEAIEHTRERIYAYLHALQPLSGCAVTDAYQRGRELVAILAETSEGHEPARRRLTPSEAADVVAFMSFTEPRNRATFYRDLPGRPSVECGFHFVLDAVERTLRGLSKARGPSHG